MTYPTRYPLGSTDLSRRPAMEVHGLAGLGAVAVAEAADRLDGRVAAGLGAELAAQPHDAVLHPVRADARRVAPGQLKQLDRGKHLAAAPDEGGEQPELGGGELDGGAGHQHRVVDEVDLHAAVVEDPGQRGGGVLPAQQGLHPGGELGVAERLGEVVVRSAAQAAHLVGLLAVRSEHEHGNLAQLADSLKYRPPVHLWQPDVEDHDVRVLAVEDAQSLPPLGRRGHLKPVPAEHGPDAERDVRVVLDHQYPVAHRAPELTALRGITGPSPARGPEGTR